MRTRIEQDQLNEGLLPSYVGQGHREAALVEPVAAAIQAAIADSSVIAAEVVAGRIYTRKEEEAIRPFGSAGASRYESPRDDFYLQIGIRVPHFAAKPVIEAISRVEAGMDAQNLHEAQERLAQARERTAAAAAEEARVQAEVDRLEGRKE